MSQPGVVIPIEDHRRVLAQIEQAISAIPTTTQAEKFAIYKALKEVKKVASKDRKGPTPVALVVNRITLFSR